MILFCFFKHQTHVFFNQLKFLQLLYYISVVTQNAVPLYWKKTKLKYFNFFMDTIFLSFGILKIIYDFILQRKIFL